MWISARTATTLAAAALLLVMAAVAAPLIPRAHLPSLPEEKPSASPVTGKYGAATPILEAPERVRAQKMAEGIPTKGGAELKAANRYGTGPAVEPKPDAVQRLNALLKDPHIVADPRAATAEVAYVVRLVRGDQKVDVMVDPVNDRLVVALDQTPVGSYSFAGLHKEFADLTDALFPSKP